MHLQSCRTILIVLLCLLCVWGCRVRPEIAQPVRPSQRPELVLRGVEVRRVALARPFTTNDLAGQKQTFRQAFFVLLTIDDAGRLGSYGASVDIFVGEYLVPETGSWAQGAYFKVYDPALLTKLAAKEFRYRVNLGKREIRSFGRMLELPPLEKLPVQTEADVFRVTNRPGN